MTEIFNVIGSSTSVREKRARFPRSNTVIDGHAVMAEWRVENSVELEWKVEGYEMHWQIGEMKKRKPLLPEINELL